MDTSAPPPPPPSQPPPPPSKSYSGAAPTLTPPTVRPPPSSTASSSTTFLIVIAVIIAICVVASVSISFLIRCLSGRRRRSSSSVAAFHPQAFRPSLNHSSSSASDSVVGAAALSEKEKLTLVDSLPLFSLSSALSALPKSSPDCAVCLSPFLPDDSLHLLPACCHAFHAACIDNWLLLRDMPTCPLCRASITIHNPLFLPSAPPLTLSSDAITADPSRSGSFRVEIGSVSLRRTHSIGELESQPNLLRTYSIDSQFDYLVEEEVEAVVAEKPEKRPDPAAFAAAEQAAGRNSTWLKDYVDRLSSASSSFSSLRVSDRWSHRYDSGAGGAGGDASVGRLPSWHWERSARRQAENIGILGFYRWLVGAY